jgi:hypothetical protein
MPFTPSEVSFAIHHDGGASDFIRRPRRFFMKASIFLIDR